MNKRLVLIIALVAVTVAVLAFVRLRHSDQLEANITGPAAPIGAEFPREQRERFASQLQETFRAKGIEATITVQGDNSTTIQMQIPGANKEKARMAASDGPATKDLRTMGFKHLIFTNGTESWPVDLKN